MKITAEQFEKATGCEPEQDDLERCNCKKAGQVGHDFCGWSERFQQPNFMLPYAVVEAERNSHERQ